MREYGKAVVHVRTHPRHLAELANYTRLEYGPGTGPGFLLAEMERRRAQSRTRSGSALGRALRAVVGAVRSLVSSHARPERRRTPDLTR